MTTSEILFEAPAEQNDPVHPYSIDDWTQQIFPMSIWNTERKLFVVEHAVFSPSDLTKMIEFGEARLADQQDVFKNAEIDVVQTQVPPLPETREWYEVIGEVLQNVNDEHWQFALSGWYENLVYLDYAPGGFIGAHMDTTSTDRTKIGFTLLLNEPGVEYGGGEFSVEEKPVTGMHAGDMVVFPGFVRHRVSEVVAPTKRTKKMQKLQKQGHRLGLTGWLAGPWWH